MYRQPGQSRRATQPRLEPWQEAQRRMAGLPVHSLWVATKQARRGVAKPCRGTAPVAFRALRLACLARNASPILVLTGPSDFEVTT
jgi:hypothetical protein